MTLIRTSRTLLICLLLTVFPMIVPAQEAPVDGPQALTDNQQTTLDDMMTAITQLQDDIDGIETRLESASDTLAEVLSVRLISDRLSLLNAGNEFARTVIRLRDGSTEVGNFIDQAVAVLQSHLSVFDESWSDLEAQAVLPENSLTAVELAAEWHLYFELQSSHERLITLMSDTLLLLAELGADTADQDTDFIDRLNDRAWQVSILLDLAQRDVAMLNASLTALPGDTELTGKRTIAETRVVRTAGSLEHVINILSSREINVSAYRQQIVRATGALVPEDIDASVLGGLLAEWWQSIETDVSEQGAGYLLKTFIFLLILAVFWKLSQFTRQLTEKILNRSHATSSQLLHRMIVHTSANLVFALGILIALSQIGISLGPVLAGLGIAGFVMGFALQDSLSNFASGLLILFTRPYDVGDVVEIGGVLGKVEEMSLVNTTIHTLDNQRIILPNTMIWGGVIKNVTAQKERRVDMVFGISYSDDIPKTENLLNQILAEHELILDDPEPVVRLHELGDSSVNFVVRPWAKSEDFWTVYWDVTRSVKMRFDQEGISIPFPQRDVHLYRTDP